MALSVEKIRSFLSTNYPAILEGITVGGTVQEDGSLVGYTKVDVPRDENGLPETTEFLRNGWTSAEGKTITDDHKAKSFMCGKWLVPTLVNGVSRVLTGNMSAIRLRDGALGFIWNANYAVSFMATPADSKPGAKKVEVTRYVPFFEVAEDSENALVEQAQDKQLARVIGEMIAVQHGITIQ